MSAFVFRRKASGQSVDVASETGSVATGPEVTEDQLPALETAVMALKAVGGNVVTIQAAEDTIERIRASQGLRSAIASLVKRRYTCCSVRRIFR
jgi:hypothetical protein